MIRDIRIQLMSLFYSGKMASEVTEEMESFFDILKQFDNNQIDEIEIMLKKSKRENEKKEPDVDNNKLNKILNETNINSIDYESITLEQIKILESNEKLTKVLAVQLASMIGISKKTYKTKKEIFEDIYRMINNRDTMKATKNALTSENSPLS